MIGWKEGAVCYAHGKQLYANNTSKYKMYKLTSVFDGDETSTAWATYMGAIKCKEFQLNEPREGYYIPKLELDTEEKYNRAVEVFGLFCRNIGDFDVKFHSFNQLKLCQLILEDGELKGGVSSLATVKLTFPQLMAIGELKRKMNERENEFIESRELDVEMIKKVAGFEDKPAKKPKAKEAYRILGSMGIEWDNVECKWFKKEWL